MTHAKKVLGICIINAAFMLTCRGGFFHDVSHAVHHAAHKVEHTAKHAADKVKHEADKLTPKEVKDLENKISNLTTNKKEQEKIIKKLNQQGKQAYINSNPAVVSLETQIAGIETELKTAQAAHTLVSGLTSGLEDAFALKSVTITSKASQLGKGKIGRIKAVLSIKGQTYTFNGDFTFDDIDKSMKALGKQIVNAFKKKN